MQAAPAEAPEVAFRPIREEDRDFLRRLYATTREQEMAVVPWSDAEKAEFLSMQFEAQHKFYRETFTEAEFSLILVGNEPAGRLYVDRRAEEIRLIDIALLPEHRGRGLGGRLMRGLLAEAEAVGKSVTIHVERYNPALRLYERLGFRPVEDQGIYYLMEWQPLK